ncbi:MAG: YciI family protein [Bacteroidia bacterium]
MKEFMMLFVGADYQELGLSPEQLQGRMGKWFAWGAKMKEQGVLRGGEALLNQGKRVTGPQRVVSDGPFVESKELIGGYYTVAAEKVEDVVKIAEDYPDYDLGGAVEIREIMKFEQ